MHAQLARLHAFAPPDRYSVRTDSSVTCPGTHTFGTQAKASADAGAESAEAARGAWQCKICFSHEVDVAYTGCGHIICSSCARASQSNRCPICRKASSSLLKLYKA